MGRLTVVGIVIIGTMLAGPPGRAVDSATVPPYDRVVLISDAMEGLYEGPRTVRIADTDIQRGQEGTVRVELDSEGDENALGFSIVFDPALLTYGGAAKGGGAASATLLTNSGQAAAGLVGFALALPAGESFVVGTHEIVAITFAASTGAQTAVTEVMFGDQPISREVSDPEANILAALYDGGLITLSGPLTATPTEPPVPTSTSTAVPTGISTPTATSTGSPAATRTPTESPVPTDTPVPTATPTEAETATPVADREVRVVATSIERGQDGSVSVELVSKGDENALGFSVHFDPAILTYRSASGGSDAGGATLNINDGDATLGRLGCALALAPGETFQPGVREIVVMTFRADPGSLPPSTELMFADEPIVREISDPLAESLDAVYAGGTVTLTGSVRPTDTPTPTSIPGDIDGDGKVDKNDLFAFSLWWQSAADTANARCNLVADSAIDQLDLYRFAEEWHSGTEAGQALRE